MRKLLAAYLLFAIAISDHALLAESPSISTIAFGSCARGNRPQPIWDEILAHKPDLFLFLGDNVYVDQFAPPKDRSDITKAYDLLATSEDFNRFRKNVPILATWDDHDYGLNDAGKEFFLKVEAQEELLKFFKEDSDSPRWKRGGVYGEWSYGPIGRRVQIILLDTRYFRDPLQRRPGGRTALLGPYVTENKESATILGEEQWTWLESCLKKPADLRIIGSSIQVVSQEHGWECWGNFPEERKRLYSLLNSTKASGAICLSGDRHLFDVSRDDDPLLPYPLYDITSSGLNQGEEPVNEANQYRAGPVVRSTNYGLIRIDWDAEPTMVKLEGYKPAGKAFASIELTLDDLACRN